jgi:hypothetical protein
MHEMTQKLIGWKEALEAGDIDLAIDLHDDVTEHIIEHKDSKILFAEAKMNPQAFVEWAGPKETIREQLDKPPEQKAADFEEALEQMQDYVERMSLTTSVKDAVKYAAELQNAARQYVLNASILEHEGYELPAPKSVQRIVIDDTRYDGEFTASLKGTAQEETVMIPADVSEGDPPVPHRSDCDCDICKPKAKKRTPKAAKKVAKAEEAKPVPTVKRSRGVVGSAPGTLKASLGDIAKKPREKKARK